MSSDESFDLTFFESVLEKVPDDPYTITALGFLYSNIGNHQEALQMDRRLAKKRPTDPLVRYNLACSLALCGDADQAIEALQTAITLGYDDLTHLLRDDDLKSLHNHPHFPTLVASLSKSTE